jgi:hypothetical protein
VNYSSHLQRLSSGVITERKKLGAAKPKEILNDCNGEQNENAEMFVSELMKKVTEELDTLLRANLLTLMQLCLVEMAEATDFRFTIYISCCSPIRCEFHVEKFPKTPVSPVEFAVWTFRGRDNPQIKSSSWLECVSLLFLLSLTCFF